MKESINSWKPFKNFEICSELLKICWKIVENRLENSFLVYFTFLSLCHCFWCFVLWDHFELLRMNIFSMSAACSPLKRASRKLKRGNFEDFLQFWEKAVLRVKFTFVKFYIKFCKGSYTRSFDTRCFETLFLDLFHFLAPVSSPLHNHYYSFILHVYSWHWIPFTLWHWITPEGVSHPCLKYFIKQLMSIVNLCQRCQDGETT